MVFVSPLQRPVYPTLWLLTVVPAVQTVAAKLLQVFRMCLKAMIAPTSLPTTAEQQDARLDATVLDLAWPLLASVLFRLVILDLTKSLPFLPAMIARLRFDIYLSK